MADTAHEDAVRAAYDDFAEAYVDHVRGDLDARPLERAMLAAFAEVVAADGGGPVADVGCGPGRVTAHLRGLGTDAFGIDLSPGMIAIAHREHPGLRFEVGTLTALDLPDGGLAGVLAWYSLIHVAPEMVPVALEELYRVTAPGGRLLAAFQVGDEPLYVERVGLDFHRLRPDRVAAQLEEQGFSVDARLVRAPEPTESVPQAFLLAHRPR
jgi:SAM-dependent methyltransferase